MSKVREETQLRDRIAGLVLGVESVPDGLAAGLLAGEVALAGASSPGCRPTHDARTC
jgi:hypothetical protein